MHYYIQLTLTLTLVGTLLIITHAVTLCVTQKMCMLQCKNNQQLCDSVILTYLSVSSAKLQNSSVLLKVSEKLPHTFPAVKRADQAE